MEYLLWGGGGSCGGAALDLREVHIPHRFDAATASFLVPRPPLVGWAPSLSLSFSAPLSRSAPRSPPRSRWLGTRYPPRPSPGPPPLAPLPPPPSRSSSSSSLLSCRSLPRCLPTPLSSLSSLSWKCLPCSSSSFPPPLHAPLALRRVKLCTPQEDKQAGLEHREWWSNQQLRRSHQ